MAKYKCPHSFTTTEGDKCYCIECGAEQDKTPIKVIPMDFPTALEEAHKIGIEKGRQTERERIFKKLEGCDVNHYGRAWVGIACCKECWQALKEGKDV